jgi:hypothetical protein
MRGPFAGAVRKPITLKHVPLIWECMLGTVNACNPKGTVMYFDYDYDEAREFCGQADCTDLRVAKNKEYWGYGLGPRVGQWVLYGVRKTP